MGNMMDHMLFKARIAFFLFIVPYRGPQFLTGKYKHLCNKMRIITTAMVVLRKLNEI